MRCVALAVTLILRKISCKYRAAYGLLAILL